ncbi:hypothetical protein [Aminobacter aminovorans]|jgi:hypothetical protein|uniref:Uncharacterized protein n=1 Tax=Aminobacter aminovorans TaxID=83263 RepID=A0AAC8YVE9_AMIAI|nr:hypothetical protein [Aminobacter aminovorans]AMS45207.1 hypothetical protein AA2016_6311 [Aminobacter aminovorans]MBB3705033.1 hypothetical protein [Aminobacter aminovorans]
MADSDNTTALPFVTQGGRRKSCAVDDEAESDISVGVRLAEKIAARLLGTIDPCVVLLQEWEQAHHMAVVLCRLQQRLEIRIRNALRASEPRGGPENDGHSPLLPADQQARWNKLDREVGYSRARAAEAQAVEAEEEILDAVAATPAQSLAGVIAKLKIIAGGGENMGDTSAFPWPQIQSVLADLQALGDRGADVLPADSRRQRAEDRGLDGETNRLRTSMPDGTIARESHPRRS